MKILLTGSNGFLGQELLKQLAAQHVHEVIATGRGAGRIPDVDPARIFYRPLDITDSMAVTHFCLQHQPDLVIHAAAVTQPDDCERDKPGCWNNNVTATCFLMAAAKQVGAAVIYISTDFVFDGLSGPYDESAVPAPVNYYGASKLAAEKEVLASGLQATVIRTVLVYGKRTAGGRHNIVTWAIEKLAAKEKIKVVTDQFRTPTYVGDLAKGILLAIEKKATGIFHISGTDMMTPYDMVMKTAAHFKYDTALVEPVSAATFKEIARRPARTGFICTKAATQLGYTALSFEEGLIYCT
jgi:dTDP-4-dehydrorhamnose reductase